MNYRFQKFATVYPEFARSFEDSLVGPLTYAEIHERFVGSRYGLSDFYSAHMSALGNESQDVFASVEPMQRAWAREHGVKDWSAGKWFEEVVLAQVREFRPDVIYLQDLYAFDRELRQKIRTAAGRRPTLLVGWRSAPTTDFSVFGDLDLVLTAFPHYVERFERAGVRVRYMPLAFEPKVAGATAAAEKPAYAFTFVGQPGNARGPHARRHAILSRLLASTPLEIWGQTEARPPYRQTGDIKRVGLTAIFKANRMADRARVPHGLRKAIPLISKGLHWESDPTATGLESRYRDRFHTPVFGLEQFKVLGDSMVTLNVHGDFSRRFASNLRLFEATGMGTCLLTERQRNLKDLFEPDHEVVTYGTTDECREKALYLMQNESERKRISAAGRRRTHRDHTFARRVEELDVLIRELMRSRTR